MDAVKNEITIMAVNIHINPTIRPPSVRGDLSPYPTVVMVTAAHQNPLPIPSAALPPNSSWFSCLSKIHTRIPQKSNNPISKSTTHQKSGVNSERIDPNKPVDLNGTAIPRPVT